jgi:hypothetical protein
VSSKASSVKSSILAEATGVLQEASSYKATVEITV